MSKKKIPDLNDLQQQHVALLPKCQTLCIEIVRQIEHLIETDDIKLAVPIQYRAKKWDSIYNKLSEGRFNIKKDISELQDLAGLRIITLFQRDALKTALLVEQQFKLIKKYRTEDKLGYDQFGYSSIHMIIEVPTEWRSVPTLSNLVGMKMEIQIRTLSQHSWAEASKVLQYKQEENVPKPLKRSIGRISALLETVDIELERLLKDREEYISSIQKTTTVSKRLNIDLLNQLLLASLPECNYSKDDDTSVLLENLIDLGYDTTDKVLNLINGNLQPAIVEDKLRAAELQTISEGEYYIYFQNVAEGKSRLKNGVFYSFSGLVRTMLDIEMKMTWREALEAKKKT